MRILFDHGAPRGLIRSLPNHSVLTAYQFGWDKLSNGALLRAAGEAGFELLLTTDGNIRYQQKLTGRRLAICRLNGNTRWRQVRRHLDRIAAAVDSATPGSYTEVAIPFG